MVDSNSLVVCIMLPYHFIALFDVCFSIYPFRRFRNICDDKVSIYTCIYVLAPSVVIIISNDTVCATSKASDQPAHARSLIRAFSSRLGFL